MITYSFALYAISDGEHFKVGKVSYHADSWKPRALDAAVARRAALQVGNPRFLRVVAIADLGAIAPREAAMHERTAHDRMGATTRRAIGEWFRCTDAARACLRDLGFVEVGGLV